jgi:hypothetical protein
MGKPVKLLALVALALSLVACAGQRQREAKEAIQRAVADCKAPYAPNTHYLDRTNCEAPIRRWAMQHTNVPSDMADLYLAKRAAIAARLDSGQITKEQANVEITQAAVEMNQVIAERNRANALTTAAVLSAMPQPQPYQPTPYVMPHPVTTNCMRTGTMVNCTSY